MSRRHSHLALSAFGWIGFNVVVVWTIAFLSGVIVPVTVDGTERLTTAPAVTLDLALFGLFALQHSVMARRSVKTWMQRRVPAPLERTTYVMATNLCLALLLGFWQPFGGQVWDVQGVGAVVLWVLCGAGWALAIASTFAVDHRELVGLRQAGWGSPRTVGTSGLQVGGLHRVVRHPLMTGLLVAFWTTPDMGAGRLLFAAAATGYIALGVMFEERDLWRTFGAEYAEYAERVPAVVPGLALVRRSQTRSGGPGVVANSNHVR